MKAASLLLRDTQTFGRRCRQGQAGASLLLPSADAFSVCYNFLKQEEWLQASNSGTCSLIYSFSWEHFCLCLNGFQLAFFFLPKEGSDKSSPEKTTLLHLSFLKHKMQFYAQQLAHLQVCLPKNDGYLKELGQKEVKRTSVINKNRWRSKTKRWLSSNQNSTLHSLIKAKFYLIN